jgi:predicted MFS family arabinose efflux permease
MPNIILPDIMEQFGISAATFGQFSGVYYIGYSLMHLPIGIMLDRFGPKKVMSLCIVCTIIGQTPLLFADHWIYPIIGRFFIGVGSSAAILGVFKIIRMIFDEKRFARMLSFSVTIGLIGAIYGGGPVSYLRDQFGYQAVIQIFAIAGLILAAMTLWIIPDVKHSNHGTVISDIKEVIKNKRVVWSCIFAGLMVGPLEGFADVWGTVFLKEVYGLEGTMAASMPSFIFIGMCFGGPVLTYIGDKIGNYLATVIGAGIVMSTCFTSMLLWPMPSWILSINFILVGICCAYQILAIYKASTYVREQVAGLTTAIANMIIMIFGYGFHTMIGSIINYTGGPNSCEALICGTSVIPITLIVGVVGFGVLSRRESSVKVKQFQ